MADDLAAHLGEFTNLTNDPQHAGLLQELRGVLAAKLPSIGK